MKEVKVFVASSNRFVTKKDGEAVSKRSKKDAETLFNLLKKVKNKVQEESIDITATIDPWWEVPNLKSAGNVLDEVQKIAHEYDVGVFVLGRDHLSYTNSKKKVYHPNGNVLIELGLFIILGKEIFILKDDGVIIPSDINNRTTSSLKRLDASVDGLVGTIIKVGESLYKIKSENAYKKACVYYDTDLSDNYVGFYDKAQKENVTPINKWETKGLYIGTKSAYLWSEIEKKPDYLEYLSITNFIDKHRDHFNKLRIDNVISFGPGIGKIDSYLMSRLTTRCYIPVDMNVSLAISSMNNVGANANVPFAVVDDFETNDCYNRLTYLIKSKRNEIGSSNLFVMLGVTFSNLSMTCDIFLRKMQELLQDKNDYLLLDVILAGDKEEAEIRTKLQEQINKEYRQIIINSIKKKGFTIDDLDTNQLTIDFIHDTNVEYKMRTKVEGTKIAKVTYNKNTLLIAKYYQFEKIRAYFAAYFDVELDGDDDKRFMPRGIFLLKKKSRKSTKSID